MFPTIRKNRKPSRTGFAKYSWMKHVFWISPVLIIASLGMLFWSGPTITSCTYEISGNETQPCELPLRTKTDEGKKITVRVTMYRHFISPSSFLIVPDDCLQTLIINGKLVGSPSIPLCDYSKGAALDLHKWLKTGTNRIEAIIHNNGGDAQFRMQPTWGNPSILISSIIAGAALFLFMLTIMLRHKRAGWSQIMIAIFVLASVIRVYYLGITPYSVRAYDADGHIEYIEYLYNNFSLPAPNAGWEFWQPPLYYAVSSVVYGLSKILDAGREQALYCVQELALVLSIWTLLIVWKIGAEIFTEKKDQEKTLPLFFGLIAFNPALVMLSARINNDVLIVPLMTYALLLIIRWWKNGHLKTWYALMIIIGLSILAKSSGLLLLPIAFICLCLKFPLSWKKKLREGTIGFCIVMLIAGWLNIYRTVEEHGKYSVVANVDSLNSALEVQNTPLTFVTFNPVRMIKIPYANAWEDASGRNNFWEYVYRTGLFGEFDLGASQKQTASWIVFWSLLLFAGAIAGFIRLVPSWKTWLPLLLVSVILPLAHAAFRFQNPYSPSQDFRHVFLLLIPLCSFTAIAIDRMPTSFLRLIATLCAQIFMALCCMLLVTL